MKRAKSIVGLTAQVMRLYWARLGRPGRIALMLALLVGAVAAASFGRCLLSSGCSLDRGGCPYARGASPCSR